MSGRKPKYIKKPFESNCSSSDVSANIYESMMTHPAYIDLSANQKVLYEYCKLQYYAEKRKPNNDPEQFTMNQNKWCFKYRLYTKNNAKGFYRDMEALIDHGFIDCVESGRATRTKSIYKFSSAWLNWGTERFAVSPADMTAGMLAKRRKETQS